MTTIGDFDNKESCFGCSHLSIANGLDYCKKHEKLTSLKKPACNVDSLVDEFAKELKKVKTPSQFLKAVYKK